MIDLLGIYGERAHVPEIRFKFRSLRTTFNIVNILVDNILKLNNRFDNITLTMHNDDLIQSRNLSCMFIGSQISGNANFSHRIDIKTMATMENPAQELFMSKHERLVSK